MGVEQEDRWRAAGIVFDIGHPVADMGDDRSAGPIMEMVVEFWPNHYQALYHAGASNYALGRYERAQRYLEEFLAYYDVDDGFSRNAKSILKRLRAP
jgi:predicted HD phosphohydrolase